MNGILIHKGKGPYRNIGDYIQSIAGAQFFKTTDCYVNREKLNTFNPASQVNAIMNGWYMWFPENFPPVSNNLNPLWVSVHIRPAIEDRMLTPDGVEYFKKYAPIGARDLHTMRTLQEQGVDSYFSGCLSLTLGNTYKSEDHKTGPVYFVDPYYEFPYKGGPNNKRNMILGSIQILRYFPKLLKFANRFTDRILGTKTKYIGFKRWICAAYFYRAYHKVFADDVLFNAEFISHDVHIADVETNEKLLGYADLLLKKYSQAKLVVTSRIHCALPCLGLNTPNIFVMSPNLKKEAYTPGGRLEGLVDMFRVLSLQYSKWDSEDSFLSGIIKNNKITSDLKIQNLNYYKTFRDNLNQTVRKWVDNNN